MPISGAKTIKESILLLSSAFSNHTSEFKTHVRDEETRFHEIGLSLTKLSSLEISLAKVDSNQASLTKLIEVVVQDLKKDVEHLESQMSEKFTSYDNEIKEFKERLTSIEKWKWTVMGAVPTLTLLGLWVLRHVFNITF